MLSDSIGMNRSNRVGMSVWYLDPSLQGDELLAVSRGAGPAQVSCAGCKLLG